MLKKNKSKMTFDLWWDKAKHDFDSARATSFYRYQFLVFQDLLRRGL